MLNYQLMVTRLGVKKWGHKQIIVGVVCIICLIKSLNKSLKIIMIQSQIDKIIKAAIEMATQLNVSIAVSIVDTGGHLRAFMRMEECSYASIEASRKKAVSASAFKMPTDVIGDVIQKVPTLRDAFTSFPDIFTLGGGLPIIVNGKLIGGIGVSGLDSAGDKAIAEKSLLAL